MLAPLAASRSSVNAHISTVWTFDWTGELLATIFSWIRTDQHNFRGLQHSRQKPPNDIHLSHGIHDIQFSQVSYDSLGRLWKLSTGECVHVSCRDCGTYSRWTLRVKVKESSFSVGRKRRWVPGSLKKPGAPWQLQIFFDIFIPNLGVSWSQFDEHIFADGVGKQPPTAWLEGPERPHQRPEFSLLVAGKTGNRSWGRKLVEPQKTYVAWCLHVKFLKLTYRFICALFNFNIVLKLNIVAHDLQQIWRHCSVPHSS